MTHDKSETYDPTLDDTEEGKFAANTLRDLIIQEMLRKYGLPSDTFAFGVRIRNQVLGMPGRRKCLNALKRAGYIRSVPRRKGVSYCVTKKGWAWSEG